MMARDFGRFLAASPRDRLDVFLAAAQRQGTPVQNIEKDFWVCWTLDTLYNGLPPGSPRLLFKGGTSLSKAFALINRFSEDIDIVVFREDLAQPATVEELEALSGRRRKEKLQAIRAACQSYIGGALLQSLAALLVTALAGVQPGPGNVEMDETDRDGQTLRLWYPAITATDDAYIIPVVRIESGAKSALDPHRRVTLQPYIATELPDFELTVTGITAIEPEWTLWDKILIAHGLRRWFERRGEVRQQGHRISRHYYDLHCLKHLAIGSDADLTRRLAADCVRHARMFFNRPDLDLASATLGSLAISPAEGMMGTLRQDYGRMQNMIFGSVPSFDEIMTSVAELENEVNQLAHIT